MSTLNIYSFIQLCKFLLKPVIQPESMISSLYHLYPEQKVELKYHIAYYFAKKPTSFLQHIIDNLEIQKEADKTKI